LTDQRIEAPVAIPRDEEFSPAPYVTAMRKRKLGGQSPLPSETDGWANPRPLVSPAKLLRYRA